jgi:RimJ/RimL family protein N-acetyltransferase
VRDLRLVPLGVDHLSHVMTWVNDRDVMQYFANRQTAIGEDEERAYIAALAASRTDRAYSVFAGDHYVGQCSLNQIYWPARNGRLFVVVRRDMQGRGYGPEAVRRILDLAWGELDLRKVWLIVRRDNRSAQAMYLKLGFDFEGVLRDEYCVGDRWFDMVRMAIVRTS